MTENLLDLILNIKLMILVESDQWKPNLNTHTHKKSHACVCDTQTAGKSKTIQQAAGGKNV